MTLSPAGGLFDTRASLAEPSASAPSLPEPAPKAQPCGRSGGPCGACSASYLISVSRTERSEEEEEEEGEAEAAAAKKPRVEVEEDEEKIEEDGSDEVWSIGAVRARAAAGTVEPLRLAAVAHAEDANVALREVAAAREVIVGAMFLTKADSSIERRKE